MAQPLKNILLIGASGKLGSFILTALIHSTSPIFTVTILTRTTSPSTFPSNPNLRVLNIEDDYPTFSLISAFTGQDAVISTIATSAASLQKRFTDIAIQAGVKRFIPSEFGSDVLNEKAMTLLPQYFQGKREVVEYLQMKEREGMSMTWCAFVTGPFFDLAMQIGYLGFDVRHRTATLYNAGTTRFSTTTRSTISHAVLSSLIHPDETANRYLHIHSFTVTQREILAAFQKATGTEWEVTYVDVEKDKDEGLQMLKVGDGRGAANVIRYINLVGRHGGDYMLYRKGSNDMLGLEEESLDEVVAAPVNGLKS